MINMTLLRKLFSTNKESVYRMIDNKDSVRLIRALKSLRGDRDALDLLYIIMNGLESINNPKAWNEAIKVLCNKPHPIMGLVSSSATFTGRNDAFGDRNKAIRLLSKTGEFARFTLERAFDLSGETEQKEGYYGGDEHMWEVNGAIIRVGKSMIPFLKQKLSDRTRVRYTAALLQSDRASILLKELDKTTIADPRVLEGLINVAKKGIPLQNGNSVIESELGKLSACEGLIWLGKTELVIDQIEEFALRPEKEVISNIRAYEKSLSLLGQIRNPQAIAALEKAFETNFRSNCGRDFTGNTLRYMIATEKAIINCGELMVPFLQSKLTDNKEILYGTSESYEINKIYLIKQSDRAKCMLEIKGVEKKRDYRYSGEN